MLAAAILNARSATDPGNPGAYTTPSSLRSLETQPLNILVDSSTPEILACPGWYLPVGLLANQLEYYVTKSFPTPTDSWEFVTTLDYEWMVIRRHRPYRWTIWVRDDRLFL